MSRDDAYLVDILESAKLALDYVAGKSWDDFYGDIQCQNAAPPRIEIIGEAARHVSLKRKRNILKFPGGI